jgi:hypothetical protein
LRIAILETASLARELNLEVLNFLPKEHPVSSPCFAVYNIYLLLVSNTTKGLKKQNPSYSGKFKYLKQTTITMKAT